MIRRPVLLANFVLDHSFSMRNTALRKEILLLAAPGLVIACLVIYVITSLLAGDRQSQLVSKLSASSVGLLEGAEVNWTKKKEGESIDLEKEVVPNLSQEKNILNNLYSGKANTLDGEIIQFPEPDSENRKVLIKQSIVAIEKLQEQIKAGDEKASAQFEHTHDSIQKVLTDYREEATSSWSRVMVTAWITLFATVVFIAALIILAYRKLNGLYEKVRASQAKVEEEAQRVDQLSGFIEAMASGNYDMNIEAKAEDELSNTLISMRDKLKNNFVEEQQRNWSTSGLAKIGEILRSTGDSTELYDGIIKFVVKYTNSNQGGLFILDDTDEDNRFLNLVACYAFERKKFLTKKVQIGDGLVGQCFLEAERIHLTEIPTDYIRITSGLGGENPTSCLLVPLKVNDKIFGVIELASFKIYPDHVVDLVEKFAESIASTISNVKINESTRLLLAQTQQQAEEMKSQEEEMRQNMEELSATQEEMHRKEREYVKRISDLESELSMSEKV